MQTWSSILSISNILPNQVDIFDFWQNNLKTPYNNLAKDLQFLTTWEKFASSVQIYSRIFGLSLVFLARWEVEKIKE
jgi:hypothetical protein